MRTGDVPPTEAHQPVEDVADRLCLVERRYRLGELARLGEIGLSGLAPLVFNGIHDAPVVCGGEAGILRGDLFLVDRRGPAPGVQLPHGADLLLECVALLESRGGLLLGGAGALLCTAHASLGRYQLQFGKLAFLPAASACVPRALELMLGHSRSMSSCLEPFLHLALPVIDAGLRDAARAVDVEISSLACRRDVTLQPRAGRLACASCSGGGRRADPGVR